MGKVAYAAAVDAVMPDAYSVDDMVQNASLYTEPAPSVRMAMETAAKAVKMELLTQNAMYRMTGRDRMIGSDIETRITSAEGAAVKVARELLRFENEVVAIKAVAATMATEAATAARQFWAEACGDFKLEE